MNDGFRATLGASVFFFLAINAGRAQPLSLGQEAALRQGQSFKDCAGCPEMIVIPPGSVEWRRGGDPPTVVVFSKPFAISKFEVTVDQFSAFVTETSVSVGPCNYNVGGRSNDRWSWRHPGFFFSKMEGARPISFTQTGKHPVVCVNRDDANRYADWLRLKSDKKSYRLPSAAEWEFAARSGSKAWYDLSDLTQQCKKGNVADQSLDASRALGPNFGMSCNDRYPFTSPVGSFPANAFGVFDMLGNVDEWVADCSAYGFEPPADGSPRLQSGDCGGMAMGNSYISSASGSSGSKDSRIADRGFRVMRALETR